MRRSAAAGVGALAFAVLTFAGMLISNGPGGNYKASDVDKYVRSGHRPAVFIGIYLGLLGIAGLAFLLARLRDALSDSRRASLFWGLGVASVAGLAAGFAVSGVVPMAMGYGGKSFTVPANITYLTVEAGWVILSGAAVLLGVALLVFVFSGAAVPAWARWSTLVAALGAIAGYAFFPFALVLLWALALGIWLLVADRVPAAAPVGA